MRLNIAESRELCLHRGEQYAAKIAVRSFARSLPNSWRHEMSENDRNGFGSSTGQGFGARNTATDPLNNMVDGHDDPNRGPLDRAANALEGRDDPNRGPLDRMANALDGRDDPTRGPVDRLTNAAAGGSGAIGAAAGMSSPVAAGGSAMAGASSMSGQRVVSAVFDSHAEAERAVTQLRTAGVRDSDLSIIAQHGGKTTTTSGDGEITDEHHRNVLRGILGGGALGAGLGIAALAIPGVGPLAAAGAIAASAMPEAAALGALVGATAGTLNEVLTKHGVSDEDASYYSDRIKSGGVFVSVDTSASGVSGAEAQNILYRSGGHSSSQARMA
jgi:hypothetical protein